MVCRYIATHGVRSDRPPRAAFAMRVLDVGGREVHVPRVTARAADDDGVSAAVFRRCGRGCRLAVVRLWQQKQ
jgi:hypothetical protein